MLSPQLRKKVFNLWTMFWSSGMTNPLVAIEQITYLLFLKQLEALDAQRTLGDKPSLYGVRPNCKLPHPDNPAECTGHDFCRWSHITKDPTHELFSQYVFPWLRELDTIFAEFSNGGNGEIASPVGQGIMTDAYFQFPRDKVATLESAIKTIDALFPETNWQLNDLMGNIFEYLLSEIRTSGKNGQFRTPRHIIRFMVELLDPQPGERLIDPASGTGGFLFSTIQHLRKQVTPSDELRLEADGTPHRLRRGDAAVEPYLSGEYFTGYDNDRTMVRIGWMNLILHGVGNPFIVRLDSLGKSFPDYESGKYQLVLANPPFTGHVDKGDLHKTRFPRKSPNSKGS
jgi:type I restriction enzyme M protein